MVAPKLNFSSCAIHCSFIFYPSVVSIFVLFVCLHIFFFHFSPGDENRTILHYKDHLSQETMAVCSENHTKRINIRVGKMQSCRLLKQVVRTVTTGI
jgi:hypothetical protein